MLSHLLYCRGYKTAPEIQNFFIQGSISHDPFLLPDMEEAVERIAQACENGERVAIYGDFDCDGVTSAAVLMETLRGCGLDPVAHIPTREDGHGLHRRALADLCARGVSLIITADCGIGAVDEVLVALDLGLEVIITDHHEPHSDGTLPDCLTLSPTRHDSMYPWRFLSGVGMTYKLAQALKMRMLTAPEPRDVLDLVALGTVADVVPLRDENRSLVIDGLSSLQRSRRVGLRALFDVAGVERAKIDPVSIGYYLGPRINAALITTDDPEVAASLARELSNYNEQRQDLVAEKVEEILADIGPAAVLTERVLEGEKPPLLIVIGDWPAGISGLLASKLVDEYGLPAFVGTNTGDGIVTVSARSIPEVNIDEILDAADSSVPGGLFLGHGGHSAAAGFRVAEERFSVAKASLEEQAAKRVSPEHIGAILEIDAEVRLGSLSLAAAEKLRTLAPFGRGFEEPLFLSRDVLLKRRSSFSDGRHVKVGLLGDNALVDGILFNVSEAFMELPLGSRLDVVYHLQLNERNGLSKPELCVRDWRANSR
jgi:single-stranded-DNA-specific exonuclease